MIKQITLTLLLVLTFKTSHARPIINKTVNDCGKNLLGQVMCGHVKQELVIYQCGTVAEPKNCEGWVLTCSGSGTTACKIDANSQTINDAIDDYWGNFLLDLANNYIDNNVLTGTHSETVVLSDQTVRIYTVVWSITIDVNGNANGYVSVSCNV
jgi:hypothetical protein